MNGNCNGIHSLYSGTGKQALGIFSACLVATARPSFSSNRRINKKHANENTTVNCVVHNYPVFLS